MSAPRMPGQALPETIRLVVSDIDGTLVGPDKSLSPATIEAAHALRAAGIKLCLVSSRAPRGMAMYVAPLGIDTPRAGLNGGLIVGTDGEIIAQLALDREAVSAACDMLSVHDVDAWLFRGHDWIVRNLGAPYVEHEHKVTQVAPRVETDFHPFYDGVNKIMGSSTNYPLLERTEIEIAAMLKGQASVHRSSNYYLDITHPDANKGFAAASLAKSFGFGLGEVACIGDMSNDVPMLERAGIGIAMGNASDFVKSHANAVTAANDADGWARAMRDIVLPRAPKN